MRRGYVYILANKPFGTLYIGVTNNLNRRVFEHREGIASAFTKRYRVTMLVWYEEWPTVPDAIQRETSSQALETRLEDRSGQCNQSRMEGFDGIIDLTSIVMGGPEPPIHRRASARRDFF